ncbi:hypothetical protein [Nocardia sp. SYP-A9097]|uniref:hypothetical protein n=1 Tax=Nocardia sp. SYP-A9097 TaxID=2663237 RepID=UPI00129C0342|nr:hypothetical protein [Nocardia sp. SYP-A9097]
MNSMIPPTGAHPVPEDVRTSCQLWCAALALGVVQVIAVLVSQLGQRGALAQEMVDRAQGTSTPLTLAQAQLQVLLGLTVIALLWLALNGAGAAVVYQLWRGKNWARAVLTGYGFFLVLGAALAMFGKTTQSGVAGVVAGGAAIVQAVLAGGAVFLCHRTDSEPHFRPGPL